MNPQILEQVQFLKGCQVTQRGFSARLRQAREAIALAEDELHQAQLALKQAQMLAQQDALMDPDLTSDIKRKTAIEKALSDSPDVKLASEEVRLKQKALNKSRLEEEQIRDHRRACEYAQTAATTIIQAYQNEGVAHVSASAHTNGR